ncbi:hypothetical protein BDA96_08G065000 [Sorghum bicolor]|uniref:Uncharacterized protein n=1 Tax=Sorghum bicolor TaxID=4558 RepID=A0A921U6T4_SORBI|nr:hypothetical protein BDA96_08G065000 [Sorghum bicolor]
MQLWEGRRGPYFQLFCQDSRPIVGASVVQGGMAAHYSLSRSRRPASFTAAAPIPAPPSLVAYVASGGRKAC